MVDTRSIIQKTKGTNNSNIGKDGRVIATQGMPLNYREFYWEPDFRSSAPENAGFNPEIGMIKGVPVDGYDSYYWRTLREPISEELRWNDNRIAPKGYTYNKQSDATRDNGLQAKYNKMMDIKTFGNSRPPVTDDLGIYNEYYPPEERIFYDGKGNRANPYYGNKSRTVPVTDDLGIYNEYYPPEERPFYNGEGNTNRLNKNNSQPVRRVVEPMNAEANAQTQRGATQAELQRLAKTNPSLFRQIAKVMAENPLEGGKLFGMAAVPFGMAMAGNDPVMNTVGGVGMLAATGANALMDASMVAQPFVDAYGYVQSPEYIEERRRQMEEGLD